LKKFIKLPKGDLLSTFEEAALVDDEELAFLFKAVCLIGCTGHGKSSTGNSLLDCDEFGTSPGTESLTCELEGVLARWMVDTTEEPIIVLDTPGIGDTQNRDTKHIAEMVVRLKELGYVHTFLLVFNYEEPRLSEQTQDCLRLFCEVFDERFFENAMLVFTRYSNSETSIWNR
jgi:predicted GTPase